MYSVSIVFYYFWNFEMVAILPLSHILKIISHKTHTVDYVGRKKSQRRKAQWRKAQMKKIPVGDNSSGEKPSG